MDLILGQAWLTRDEMSHETGRCKKNKLYRLLISSQHRPLGERPAEMHLVPDPLQDGGEGGDGLLHQEDEADVC